MMMSLSGLVLASVSLTDFKISCNFNGVIGKIGK